MCLAIRGDHWVPLPDDGTRSYHSRLCNPIKRDRYSKYVIFRQPQSINRTSNCGYGRVDKIRNKAMAVFHQALALGSATSFSFVSVFLFDHGSYLECTGLS